AVQQLQTIGLRNDRINVLTPASSPDKLAEIKTTETEQAGTGAAIGGLVGGALGGSAGISLGTAAASLLVPGVGSVLAVGLAAAAILGAAGAVGGVVAGEALE